MQAAGNVGHHGSHLIVDITRGDYVQICESTHKSESLAVVRQSNVCQSSFVGAAEGLMRESHGGKKQRGLAKQRSPFNSTQIVLLFENMWILIER
jgi:hypothetical protein